LFVVAVIQCIARKILSGKCVAAFYLANNVVAAAGHALTAGLDVTQSDERIKSFGDSENTGHQRHRVKNAATLTADATGNKGLETHEPTLSAATVTRQPSTKSNKRENTLSSLLVIAKYMLC